MTKFLTGDGVVIAEAVVNFGIEYYTDKYEDESFDNVRGNLRDISISLIYKKWDLIFYLKSHLHSLLNIALLINSIACIGR